MSQDRFGRAEQDRQGHWWATCRVAGTRYTCGPFDTDVQALERARSCSSPCEAPRRRMTDAIEAADRAAREAV